MQEISRKKLGDTFCVKHLNNADICEWCYKKWYQKKWYFCKMGGGCGDDIHTWYEIRDERQFELAKEPGTKGAVWGIRIW